MRSETFSFAVHKRFSSYHFRLLNVFVDNREESESTTPKGTDSPQMLLSSLRFLWISYVNIKSLVRMIISITKTFLRISPSYVKPFRFFYMFNTNGRFCKGHAILLTVFYMIGWCSSLTVLHVQRIINKKMSSTNQLTS